MKCNMKKLTALIVSAILLICLVGCSKQDAVLNGTAVHRPRKKRFRRYTHRMRHSHGDKGRAAVEKGRYARLKTANKPTALGGCL